MSSLFIIGNGFDIAHGIPSRYGDFRKYLIEKYPIEYKNKDKVIYLEDIYDMSDIEIAAEILFSTMDKMAGEDWKDFEASLAHIDFSHKFPKAQHKENETFEEDQELMQKYLLYLNIIGNEFIYCADIWGFFFQEWIREVQIGIKVGYCETKKNLRSLFAKENILFLTFNYTKTLEKIYGIKNVVHIHNYVGQKLVFGHGEIEPNYMDNVGIGSSFLDDMLQSFKKDTDTALIKNKKFFRGLSNEVNKVYSYGFSYGKVDGVYIKKIIRKINPAATWYFTSTEAKDTEGLRIKKVKLRNYGFKGTFDIYEV